MVKRLAILIIVVSFTIGIIYYALDRNNANSELISGGTATHMYQGEGVIVEISDDTEVITVELKTMESKEFSFDSDNVYLDYSKVQHMDKVNVGDTIRFYFFKWHVENANIKVQYIYLNPWTSRIQVKPIVYINCKVQYVKEQ